MKINGATTPSEKITMNNAVSVPDYVRHIAARPNWLHAFFWRGVPIDALIFMPPDHDDTTQDIARQVYHRLTARIISARIARWQNYLLLAAGLLAVFGFTNPIHSSWANFLSIVAAIAALCGVVWAAPLLTRLAYAPAIADEVDAIIRRTFLRDIPGDTPADLRDELREGWLTAEGRPLSSEISSEDGRTTDARNRSYWWIAVALGATLGAGSLFRYQPSGYEQPEAAQSESIPNPWAIARQENRSATQQEIQTYQQAQQEQLKQRQEEARRFQAEAVKRAESEASAQERAARLRLIFNPYTVFVLLLTKLLFDANPLKRRAQELEVAEAVEGTAFVAAGGQAWGSLAETARARQIDEARRDEAAELPTFAIGQTTGIFSARGDFFGPNAGKTMALSLRDLQNHLLVLGGVGSGKTSGVLRPLARQAAAQNSLGLVVMDGKGSLASELSDLSKMVLVDPADRDIKISLVSGLEPAIMVDTIREILSPAHGGEGEFWINSAVGALRRGAIIAKATGGEWWSLYNAAHVVSDKECREALIKYLDAKVNAEPLLKEAVLYFRGEWESLESKTRSNILAEIRAWMSVITATPELLAWANTPAGQDTLDIGAPLTGGRIGFLIPDHRYGNAGAVVTALLKARIYAGFKARADHDWQGQGQTPVVFIIDEAQEIATSQDAQMLAIGRSLGLATVAATQGVEGVTATLGEKIAPKWLSIFGGVIALIGRSPATDQFVAARAGESWQIANTHVDGITVRSSLSIEAVAGSIATSRRQSHMHQAISTWGLGKVIKLPSRISAMLTALPGLGPKEASSRLSLGPRAVLSSGEISNLLSVPDSAIALLNRGRVPRRDIIQLRPEYPKTSQASGQPELVAIK